MLLLFFFQNCHSENLSSEINTLQVKVKKLELQKTKLVKQFATQLKAQKQIVIKTEMGGIVEQIYFQQGGFVKAGEPLYSIDQKRYQTQYQEELANLQAAKARHLQAKKNVERYQNLWDNKAIQAVELERVLLKEEILFSELKISMAKAERAKVNLRYTMIRAPFDGYLSGSFVKPGDLVVPQQTEMAILVQNDSMQADIFISEKDYFDFFANSIQDFSKSFEFQLSLANQQVYTTLGELNFIDPLIDASTGTLRLQVLFKNTDGLLKSGMNAVVQVNVKEESQKLQLVIPKTAIFKILNENFVFLLDANDQVEMRKIDLGPGIQNEQIVLNGLKQDELLIFENLQTIKTGDKVEKIYTQ